MPLGRAQTRVDVPCVEFRAFRAHTHVYESVRDTSTISTMWRVVGLRGWSDKEKVGQSGACKVRARVSRQQKEKKNANTKNPIPCQKYQQGKNNENPQGEEDASATISNTTMCVFVCNTVGFACIPHHKPHHQQPKGKKKERNTEHATAKTGGEQQVGFPSRSVCRIAA